MLLGARGEVQHFYLCIYANCPVVIAINDGFIQQQLLEQTALGKKVSLPRAAGSSRKEYFQINVMDKAAHLIAKYQLRMHKV